MSSLIALRAREGQLQDQIKQLVESIAKDQAQVSNMKLALAAAQTDQQKTAIQGTIVSFEKQIKQKADQITKLSQELAEVRLQIANLQKQAADGAPVSAGQTTAEAAAARDDGASTTNPPTPIILPTEGRISASTNAEKFTPTTDSGTNAPTRTGQTLQSTPALVAAPGGVPPGSDRTPVTTANSQLNATASPHVSVNPGIATQREELPKGGVRAELEAIFGGPEGTIVAEDNVLDQYASYTYNISLYIMDVKSVTNMIFSKDKSLVGAQLLMSSGGAPPNDNSAKSDVNEMETMNNVGSNRNQEFPLDFYMDDLKLHHVMPGKGHSSATANLKLNFKIIEPNGITFLKRLSAATQKYVARNTTDDNKKSQSYAAQNFLMVIRFYGYDENGNLVTAGKRKSMNNGLASNAIVEKYIPFMFTSIKFRIANKLVEYDCEGAALSYKVPLEQTRGVIPQQLELTGKTLQDILGNHVTAQANDSSARGFQADVRNVDNAIAQRQQRSFQADVRNVDNAIASAPPKADAIPSTEGANSLMKSLNDWQKTLVDEKKIEYPDIYEITFTNNILAQAKIKPPGTTDKNKTPMIQTTVPNQQLNPAAQNVDMTAKSVKAHAGQSIIQFLDMVVRSSTYVADQQIKIYDPVSGKEIVQGIPGNVLGWYKISMQAIPLKYDTIRKDYSYRITYQISPYAISDVQSDYFPQSVFRGTHKKYHYWFTGENRTIIDFQQDFNYLYYIVQNTPASSERKQTSNRHDLVPRRAYQPSSNQSNMGSDGQTNEPAANAADYLYSPGDQAKVKLKIIGDPAWIAQGEAASGVSGLNMRYGPFMPDGTINFDAQEVWFEVAWNLIEDYDLDTGLMDPGKNNYNRNRKAGIAGEPTQSYVYKALDAYSFFSKGKFEQEINGALIMWPSPKDQTETKRNTEIVDQYTSLAGDNRNRKGQVIEGATASGLPREARGIKAPDPSYEAPPPANYGEFDTTGTAQPPVVAPAPAPAAPTSSGQTVGPASTDTSNSNLVGVPNITISLNNGKVQRIYGQSEIDYLKATGQISAGQADRAAIQLRSRQSGNMSPVTAQKPQLQARDQ